MDFQREVIRQDDGTVIFLTRNFEAALKDGSLIEGEYLRYVQPPNRSHPAGREDQCFITKEGGKSTVRPIAIDLRCYSARPPFQTGFGWRVKDEPYAGKEAAEILEFRARFPQ